jgi:hypothetical protein
MTELGCAKRNANEIGSGLAMLEAIGEHTESERLGMGNRFIARRAVGEDALQVGNLGDPTTIFFAVDFDSQMHAVLGR